MAFCSKNDVFLFLAKESEDKENLLKRTSVGGFKFTFSHSGSSANGANTANSKSVAAQTPAAGSNGSSSKNISLTTTVASAKVRLYIPAGSSHAWDCYMLLEILLPFPTLYAFSKGQSTQKLLLQLNLSHEGHRNSYHLGILQPTKGLESSKQKNPVSILYITGHLHVITIYCAFFRGLDTGKKTGNSFPS